jgi:hypothetical protein
VRLLLNLSTRDAFVPHIADNGEAETFLRWTGDHSRDFRTLLRSYLTTLDARLRLALAAIHEIGPSASVLQASSRASIDPENSMVAFHAPVDANLYAIICDSCADTFADPAQAFATMHLSTFFGPCSEEASHVWFASGASLMRGGCRAMHSLTFALSYRAIVLDMG